MPFLIAQLPAVLNQVVALAPDTTGQICKDVKESSGFKKAPKNPNAPDPKDPDVLQSVPTAKLEAIEMLRTLGLAMLPPQHAQQNLASWHWTLLRYAYLIEPRPAGAPLRLSALAGDYRFHHMTALSEAVGVACALSYACEWLRQASQGQPLVYDPVDFDYLLGITGQPGQPVPGPVGATAHKAPNATRQPDYLVAAQDTTTQAMRLLLVECKGNSSGHGRAINQLGSAMHQLQGVIFGGTATSWGVERHAYSAVISKTGGDVVLYGVDPPEEGERWIPPRREHHAEVPARRDSAGDLVVDDPPAMAGRTLARLEARSLAWAGFAAETEHRRVHEAPSRPSPYGDIVGTTSTLRMPTGESVTVFTGAVRDMLTAALAQDPEQSVELSTKARRQVAGAEHPAAARTARRLDPNEDQERVASSVSDDGLVLQVALN